jgi:hypothetical protein
LTHLIELNYLIVRAYNADCQQNFVTVKKTPTSNKKPLT